MKGFTLIELIIYMAIVAVFLVIVSNFAWQIINGSQKARAQREVQQNAYFILEKISRAIRAGQEPGQIPVNDFISKQVKITNLEFIPFYDAYQIKLSLEHVNNLASIDLETTSSPR